MVLCLLKCWINMSQNMYNYIESSKIDSVLKFKHKFLGICFTVALTSTSLMDDLCVLRKVNEKCWEKFFLWCCCLRKAVGRYVWYRIFSCITAFHYSSHGLRYHKSSHALEKQSASTLILLIFLRTWSNIAFINTVCLNTHLDLRRSFVFGCVIQGWLYSQAYGVWLLAMVLWMARNWTWWSLGVPSNSVYSVILWWVLTCA